MRRVLRPDSACVDGGAHRGDILRFMVDLAPRGRHHAYEALPHLARDLAASFPDVRVHPVALADVVGEADFLHVENDPGYSGLRRRIYDRPDPVITSIRVPVTTLDASLPPGHPVDFLKIDIEGGEYHTLRGGVGTILRGRPVIVFEAGLKSTGQYGVTPDDLFSLITGTLRCDLSTMGRWLEARPGYTAGEFRRNWHDGPDFFFIAVPQPA
jgi:FkbM family methyltransferase